MKPARYYVQYQPDAAGLETLLRIQSNVNKIGAGMPVLPERLHLTIIHFGKYDEVLAELRRYYDNIDEKAYAAGLRRFIDNCMESTAPTGTFSPRSLGRLGATGTVLALEGSVDGALAGTHAACLEHLKTMVSELVGGDPVPFMRHSQNFVHSLDFRPHITLIRSVEHDKIMELQEDPKPLNLIRMPLEY